MKKRNLLVVCAAAALCVISVLLLVGSMGIYAEKSGTKELTGEMAESEPSDALKEVLAQGSEEKEVITEGPVPDETLLQIWDKMFSEYLAADYSNDDSRRISAEKFIQDIQAEEGSRKNEAVYADTRLSDSSEYALSPSEAGLTALKEINRLYPEDALDNLKIDSLNVEDDIGINEEAFVELSGSLDNGYEIWEPGYVSYNFQIDAVTSKIMSFGKHRAYQKGKDYEAISWTDEEIKEHAKELIETYDLTKGEQLDWSDFELYNGEESLEGLNEELEEPESSVMIVNTIIFAKEGKRYFYLNMDWETGEICNYIWMGRHTPTEKPAE